MPNDNKPQDLSLISFRGGMNDTDPSVAISDDQVVLARNVEFFNSMLGERRAGCDPIDLTGAGFGGMGSITVYASSASNWGVVGITLAPNGVIAIGNSASGGFNQTVNTYTAAYSVNANSNYLIVCVLGDSTTDKVTGVTFNAVAMTQLGKVQAGSDTGWIYIYGLAAPATGSHNVVISASGNCTNLGFVAADYAAVAASEPDSSLTQTATAVSSVTTNFTPVANSVWAIQFSVNAQGQSTSISGGSLRVFASVSGTKPTLTWTGTTSGSQDYNISTADVVFNSAGGGTWTLSVTGGNLTLNFKGAAGGAGGGTGNAGTLAAGSGGGGGSATAGTSVTLVPGKTYTLTIGSGGATDTDGGNTTFVNTTDSTTLVSLGGGKKGEAGADGFFLSGGAAGTASTGTNLINGAPGGDTTNGIAPNAAAGSNPGTGGGGGGGAAGAGWAGGNGGSGSVAGGAGGAKDVAGTDSSGKGGHTGGQPAEGGGGGGGGGIKFGLAGEASNGAGCGGGGGGGTNGTSNPAGGAGADGIGGFIFNGFNISVTLGDTNGPLVAQGAVVHLQEWFPLGDQYNSELWAIAATPNASQPVAVARRSTLSTGNYVWQQVTPADPFITNTPDIYLVNAQALDGLWFWAYNSGIDRMHVWEPSTGTLRRAGLPQPASAPTGANGGAAGAVTGARYARIRYIQKSGTTIVRRSEPSVASTIFTPDAAHAQVTWTFTDTPPGEGETHREVELSADAATWYRMTNGQIAIATGTYADTNNATGIPSAGVVSEAVGAYLLPPSAKYLGVDNDRLILAGHWFDPTRFSTVSWTPPGGDPGVGSGERVPIVTTGGSAVTSTVRLDNNVGGPITGMVTGLMQPSFATTASPQSVFYVFKWQRIYMFVNTGLSANAYNVVTLSSIRGAIPDSCFQGVDEAGAPCAYFLDPLFGPSRISQTRGIETLYGVRNTWERVNVIASDVIGTGVFYPFKRRAEWYVSVDGGNTPSARIRLQVSETGHAAKDATDYDRGWVIDDGRLSQARCCTTYTELVSESGTTRLSVRPVIGLTSPDYVQRTDVNSTDATQPFVATIISKPYLASSLLQRWGAAGASILADANASGLLNLFLIKDFGKNGAEDIAGPFAVSTAPTTVESEVLKVIDNMTNAGATYIQIELTDSNTVVLS